MIICAEKKCTGCFACKSACPKSAILTKTTKSGSLVPFIDKTKCVNCGLCRNVCPSINKIQKQRADFAYAATQKVDLDGLSSSGGVATALSKIVIKENGVVIGCAFLDGKAKHIVVKDLNGLKLLKGSKYVHSETGDTYKQAKEFLEARKTVLFIGTPCGVAGLKNFLRKDYDNLFTVDLICHGTPPFAYLKEYAEAKAKNKSWDKISFRGKKDFYLNVYNNGKIIYSRKSNEDVYFSAFLEGLTYRENCYTCGYATPERCSDITLGDFWGLDKSKLQTKMQGKVSVVLPNTEKGKALLKKCEEILLIEQRPFIEALNEKQGNLQRPSKRHAERDLFIKNYELYGFVKSVKKTSLGKKVSSRHFKRVVFSPFNKAVKLTKKVVKKIIKKS